MLRRLHKRRQEKAMGLRQVGGSCDLSQAETLVTRIRLSQQTLANGCLLASPILQLVQGIMGQ